MGGGVEMVRYKSSGGGGVSEGGISRHKHLMMSLFRFLAIVIRVQHPMQL